MPKAKGPPDRVPGLERAIGRGWEGIVQNKEWMRKQLRHRKNGKVELGK